jgi:hypothetical protein
VSEGADSWVSVSWTIGIGDFLQRTTKLLTPDSATRCGRRVIQ